MKGKLFIIAAVSMLIGYSAGAVQMSALWSSATIQSGYIELIDGKFHWSECK